MPISIDEFTDVEVPDGPSVPEQAVAFLVANDRQAFTRSEIAAGIDADSNTVGTAGSIPTNGTSMHRTNSIRARQVPRTPLLSNE